MEPKAYFRELRYCAADRCPSWCADALGIVRQILLIPVRIFCIPFLLLAWLLDGI